MAGGGIGYATLPIVPSFNNFGSQLASQIGSPLTAGASQAGSRAGTAMKGGILKTVAGVGGALAGIFAIKVVKDWAAETVGSLARIEQLNAQTANVVRSTGGAANVSASQVETLTGKLEDLTGTEAETIQKGANFLLTFKNIRNEVGEGNNVFDLTTIAMTDMARATGQDMQSAALQLGKALNDPIAGVSALARVGVGFTDQQKEQIKVLQESGDVLGAQKIVLAEVNSQFGGSGAAYAATYAGKVELIGHAWGTLSETIVGAAMPALGSVAGAVLSFLQMVNGSGSVEQFAAGIGAGFTFLMALGVPALAAVQGGISSLVLSFQIADGDITSSGINGYLEQLGYVGRLLFDAVTPLWPAFLQLGGAVFEATQSLGISVFQLLPPVLMLVASALQIVVPLVTGLSGFLVENQGIVVTVVAAYALFRGVSLVLGIVSAATAAYTAASYGAAGASYASSAATGVQAAAARGGAIAQALMSSSLVTSLVAWNAQNKAVIANTALTNGTKVAIIASSVASGIATAAQWAWNAALSANPIGIVIVLIAALVAAIIWVATQTTFFQDLWSTVTTAIGTAWTWLWGTVLQPVFAFIVSALTSVGGFFVGLWTGYVQPAITAIGNVFTWLYNNIVVPIIIGIALYFAIWGAIFTWLWSSIISPTFSLIGSIFTWLYTNIVLPYFTAIGVVIRTAGAIFSWLYTNVVLPVAGFIGNAIRVVGAVFTWWWTNIVTPVMAGIGAAFRAAYTGVIVPIGNGIQAAIRGVGAVFTWLQNNVVAPVSSFVSSAFSAIGSTVAGVAGGIRGAMEGAGNAIGGVFSGIASKVSSAFSGIVGVVRTPINGIIGLANSAISSLNGISVKIPDFVPGVGGQTFGLSIPRIPYLARGGDVAARAGGTLAVLGEAGRAETVTDLGRTNGLINAAFELAERALRNGSHDGTQVNFNGPVGLNIDDLVAELMRRMANAQALSDFDITEVAAS